MPAGLPPRVYLKVTARDAAGNVKEVVTRDPILVDLVKPRAKISGIVGPAGTAAAVIIRTELNRPRSFRSGRT